MTELKMGTFVTIGRPYARGAVIYFMASSQAEIDRVEEDGNYLYARSTRSRRGYTGPVEKFIPLEGRDLRKVTYRGEKMRDLYLKLWADRG